MAYETCVDNGATETFLHPADRTSTSPGSGLGALVNVAGGLLSIGLIAGFSVWGYNLMVRDVSGIPVVRAAEGDMRVRPEDPGGALAQHQGLSVNAVAAEGGAQAPADRLVLAPQPVQLTEEDVPMDDQAVAIVQQALAEQLDDSAEIQVDVSAVTAAAQSGSVDNLVSVLTDGVEPLENLSSDASGPEVVVQVAANQNIGISGAIASALADVPGVKVSLRPQLRPARGALRNVVPVSASANSEEVSADSLPSGTRLVQLGAYDSVDVARNEWAKFNGRFEDLMRGKGRVIQQASSGGRKFFRLRALGFDDLADARRFCSALVAEGADCIPVVTR